MRKFRLAFLTSAHTSDVVHEEASWPELVALLDCHDVREEKDGPSWCPVEFAGGVRKNDQVSKVHLLVFDDDESTEDEIRALHGRLKVAHVIHSTFSHKWRVVLPLAQSILPGQLPMAAQHARSLFGIRQDEATRDASRLYYLPSCPPGAKPVVLVGEGAWFDASASAPQHAEPIDTKSMLKGPHVTRQVRPVLRSILEGLYVPPKGERDTGLHKMMHTLAFSGESPPSDELVREILDSTLDRMDCAPEGREHWERKAWYSWTRAFKQRASKIEATDAAASSIKNVLGIGPPEEGGEPSEEEWTQQLLWNENKDGSKGSSLKQCTQNVSLVLANDPELKGTCSFNNLTKQVEFSGGPLASEHGETLDLAFVNWLQRSRYRLNLPRHEVAQVMLREALGRSYSPVAVYLQRCRANWDGQHRVKTFLHRHVTGEWQDTNYVEAVSQCFFIGAAARALQPGCKMDNMLILYGKQGLRKSTLISALANGWSSATQLDITSKDGVMLLTNYWLVELAEMSAIKGKRSDAVRGFLTKPTDEIRLPYGRSVRQFPRASVYIGTTNDEEPLDDTTGLRRFWPIEVTRKIDVDAVLAERDHLWGEAVALYEAKVPWHFDDEMTKLQELEAQAYQVVDTFDDIIRDWYGRRPPPRPPVVTTAEVARGALMIMGADTDVARSARIGDAMRRLGFKYVKFNKGGVWRRGWRATHSMRHSAYVPPDAKDVTDIVLDVTESEE